MLWDSTSNDFHSSQPRARAQVASSESIAVRNASRLAPVNIVQAITRSQAGSPTPDVPKSMTAVSTPSATRRFPWAMSPWNHTGVPRHSAARAASHTLVAASVSTTPASALRHRRVSSS
jgi:hypothetical protein